jgi:hypothetical protein
VNCFVGGRRGKLNIPISPPDLLWWEPAIATEARDLRRDSDGKAGCVKSIDCDHTTRAGHDAIPRVGRSDTDRGNTANTSDDDRIGARAIRHS